MDIRYTGDNKIDFALREIKNKGQSKNFNIKEGVPSPDEGEVGNIWIVKNSGAYFLYVKVAPDTWRKVNLST